VISRSVADVSGKLISPMRGEDGTHRKAKQSPEKYIRRTNSANDIRAETVGMICYNYLEGEEGWIRSKL